jgi:tetratricopeptide (TPR) repeat protein
MFEPWELLQSKAWGTRDALLAADLQQAGDLEGAARAYKRAAWRFSLHGGVVLLREADRGIAWYGVAICYLAMGNEGEALEALGKALEALRRVYVMQARVYDKLGEKAALGLAKTVLSGYREAGGHVRGRVCVCMQATGGAAQDSTRYGVGDLADWLSPSRKDNASRQAGAWAS